MNTKKHIVKSPKTNLEDVKLASYSTVFDVEKIKINAALTNIFLRFEKPLINSFTKRLRNRERAEEKFSDFSSYLIQNRKQIFRGFDPSRGKLHNYIYQIAHRFLNKNQLTNKISIDDITEREANTFTPDKNYEAECANTMINICMEELAKKNPEGCKFLKMKYLSNKKVKTKELAVLSGRIGKSAAENELKKAQNAIDQQIRKAKKDLHEILKKHIQGSALVLTNEEMEDELLLLQEYISWISL